MISDARHPTRVRESLGLLESLGSPDAIAAFFRARHIVGIPRSTGCCPVARWVRNVTGAEQFTTTGAYYCIDRASLPAESSPPCVRKFIQLFDLGQYPDLEEESA